jgi:hypothetical protein
MVPRLMSTQNHSVEYPTLACIALNYLPSQASSVPCERLFSTSKQTAVDRRARLHSDKFEYLQVLKSAWQKDITDFAALNDEVEDDVDLTLFDALHDTEIINIEIEALVPQGTMWHQNSCAYDAVLSIIHAIWNSNRTSYTQIFKAMNDDITGNLITNFIKHASGTKSLESVRDDLRRYLHQLLPNHFSWGQFTSVPDLLQYLLSTPSTTIQTTLKCKNNHSSENRASNQNHCVINAGTTIPADSIATWMHNLCEETRITCNSCSEKMLMRYNLLYPLPLIALDFAGHNIQINYEINVPVSDSNIKYKLRGIIYFGDSHFTSRVLLDNGTIWFHDGIVTGQKLVYDGIANLNNTHNSFSICRGKKAAAAIYIKC